MGDRARGADARPRARLQRGASRARRAGAAAGRERGPPARHRALLPRDAGHPLGLRLPDRRRRRHGRATRASSRRAASATTSTAACGWCARARRATTCAARLPSRSRTQLFRDDPAPAWARAGPSRRCAEGELEDVLAGGARWAVRARVRRADDDVDRCEEGGAWPAPTPTRSAPGRRQRGAGPGRHARHRQPLPRGAAGRRDLRRAGGARPSGSHPAGSRCMIHSGSRGLGHQVCDDALASLRGAPTRSGIRDLPDRQLACAPVRQRPRRGPTSAPCRRPPTSRGRIAR